MRRVLTAGMLAVLGDWCRNLRVSATKILPCIQESSSFQFSNQVLIMLARPLIDIPLAIRWTSGISLLSRNFSREGLSSPLSKGFGFPPPLLLVLGEIGRALVCTQVTNAHIV